MMANMNLDSSNNLTNDASCDLPKVDLSISNIKSHYSIKDKYKSRQKSNYGRLIPFEKIDKSIYKAKANCTCFITSEESIQLWIISLTKHLWEDFKGQFHTGWVEKKDDSDAICQTEFIVSDVKSSDSKDEDDFLYKVIVYIQTGKIMVQGRAWKLFCDSVFAQCLEYVTKIKSKYVEKDNIQTIGTAPNPSKTTHRHRQYSVKRYK